MPQIVPTNAAKPLALAIDIGTSSVRAVLFDAHGTQLPGSEHKERYKLTLTADGGSMADPARMRARTAKCIHKVCAKHAGLVPDIAVVGISCHWHSLMGLDAEGDPATPLYMWNDTRSRFHALRFAEQIDAATTHQRTGCRLHASYWPAKLLWLQHTQPDLWNTVSTWCGLSDWLFSADGAAPFTSLSMASATGMLRTDSLAWDAELLAELGLNEAALATISTTREPFIPHPDLVPHGLRATWYPALGDGAAANIGAGAVGDDRIAITIGTSGALRLARPLSSNEALPPALWRYLIDASTEVVGGALSGGGNVLAWIANITNSDPADLGTRAANILPDSHGLTMLPFLAGERAPSWSDALAGTITGMTMDTSPSDLLRASMEATAYRFGAVYDSLAPLAAPDHRIIANGGALLQSPLWAQIIADTLGQPVSALQSRAEASARGAAIGAMHAAGHVPSLRTDPDIRRVFSPDSGNTATYSRGRARLESLERALTTWEQI